MYTLASSEIISSCAFIVCSSSKMDEDPFTFEIELRNRLQLVVVYFFLFVVRRNLTLSHFTPRSSFEIVCSCAFIVCSSSKSNKDPFTFELELRNRLQLCFYRLQFLENERGPIFLRAQASKSFVVVFFLFVVPRKRTRTHFSSSSSFESVFSCAFIVCSSSKTNEDPFFFELELQNRMQLCFYRFQFLENERRPIFLRARASKSFVVVCSFFFRLQFAGN